jgi:hypothetical protein
MMQMLHKDIRKFYKSASVASHMGAHAVTQERNVFYAVANLQPWENRLQQGYYVAATKLNPI